MVLAAVQFTHLVDFMIIMPLGPVYRREMGLLPTEFGFVVAAYTIAAGLANLVAACFLDRFDRKIALLVCYGGFTCGTFLCAFAPDYPFLLAARIVAGAFGGVAAAVLMAIVGDAFHDSRRGTAMGVIMSSFSVASIAGLPLGLLLADELTWHAPFIVLGCLGAGVLSVAALVLPRMSGHLRGQSQEATVVGHLRAFALVLVDANHVRAFSLMVVMMFTGFVFGPYLATYLVANVGLAQDELKYIYLVGGLATLVTLTPIGRLADRHGKLRVYRLVALTTIPPILLLTNLPAGLSLWLVLVLTTAMMVTTSARMVPSMALITASAAPQQRGSFMSLNTAVQHLAAGLATAAGGALLGQEYEEGPLTGFPLVGLVSCTATLVSIYLAGRLRPAPGGLGPDTRAEPAEQELVEVEDLPALAIMTNTSAPNGRAASGERHLERHL
jgi:predicted MFS family arabinose efflux permease